ncbi:hypothetical protein [Mesorhizobium sp. WSM2239]|uniref:Uncharacterized protein n=2 Tax=unclassified Mesorhizobium TaxID=325217 RepID=A0AAU8D366_9HYPH
MNRNPPTPESKTDKPAAHEAPAAEEDGGTFTFFPIASLEDKNNYKQYYFIFPDGKIQKRVFLDTVDDRHRELLICIHYIMWSAKYFLKEGDGINIVDRDCPWDFELSVNDKDNFFVEITAIADNKTLHVINKREQRVASVRHKEAITLRELKKLNEMFPNSETDEEIARYQHAGLTNDHKVANPWFGTGKQLFTSFLPPPDKSLSEIIRSAIQNKTGKGHEGKERTVLILDNRTSLYDGKDVLAASEELGEFLAASPFREIWFYTGFFSDNDGQNSEFSYIAVKLPPDQERRFLETAAKRVPDKRGRYLMTL